MGSHDTAKLDGNGGIAFYEIDPATGAIDGRFVLAQYEGDVARETGTKVAGSGPDGSIEGTYEITTYTPEPDAEIFATGTLTLLPVKDQGAYAVVWVLNVEEKYQDPPRVPPTMIYDACALELSDRSFAIGWDNADFRTPTPMLRVLRLR